jgi:preprotein translocase subunit YajC
MDFLISAAHADPVGPGASGPMQFLPLIALFVAFYFLLIRPQQKKAKEHREMLSKLAVGNDVVTAGGIIGRITETGDTFVSVEISRGVVITVQRYQIVQVLPNGTFKAA